MAFVAIAAMTGISCSESSPLDTVPDAGAPRVALSAPSTADSTLAFSVEAADALGIKFVNVSVSGAVEATFADTIRTAQTTFSRSYTVSVPGSVPPGTAVLVMASAVDGAGNTSVPDTLRLATGNIAAAAVAITSPRTGTQAVAGKGLVLSISGRSALNVKYIGYQVAGAFTAVDSTLGSQSPMRDSVAMLDTLEVPASVSG